MEFNIKDVYFGCLTYNMENDGFYKTAPEVFIKKNEGEYSRLKSRNESIIKEYVKGTEEFLTLSEIYPITNITKQQTGLISEKKINLYLLKYNLITYKKIKKQKYSKIKTK